MGSKRETRFGRNTIPLLWEIATQDKDEPIGAQKRIGCHQLKHKTRDH